MPKKSYKNLNETNKLLFLAGLFDGEGSFGLWGKGTGRKSFQCSIEMCDKDSVQKFADFFSNFTSFLKFSDVLGPVRTCLDPVRCVWMRLEAFRSVQMRFDSFRFVHKICEESLLPAF